MESSTSFPSKQRANTFDRIRSCEAMTIKLTKVISCEKYYFACYLSATNNHKIMDDRFLIFLVNSAISWTTTYHSLARELVIVGYFNVHFDAPDNVHCFCDLLRCHGLTRHVQQPTHQDGHILDLVIDRGNLRPSRCSLPTCNAHTPI